jgi:endo-1,4-beta-xylanase
MKRTIQKQVFLGFFSGLLAAAWVAEAQPAKGANKFLGNITSRGQVRSDFGTYWNQITPENETKWGSVEGTRDRMSWTGADRVANYAKTAGIPWKFHTLAWGSQYPGWITGLSQADQLAEITEWFDETKAKYPDLPMFDVVNEAHPSHAPAPYANALGGGGASGYEWIFKAFRMARERWPNAILIYNDYNNIEYNNEVNWTVSLINAAKAANVPIDAIGCQAHDAYKINTNTLKSNIDKLAATGLPIFITEYDIGYSDDTQQLNSLKDQFPVFWNHPSIVGVTYWGYIVGETWRTGTGLKASSGTERPALTWLMQYVKDNPNPQNKFPAFLSKITASIVTEAPKSVLKKTAAKNGLRIFDLNGREISSALGWGEKRPQAPAMHLITP